MNATFRGLGATDVPPIAPGYPNRLLDQLHMAAILEDHRRHLVSVTYRQFLLGAARRSLCLRLWSFERSLLDVPS